MASSQDILCGICERQHITKHAVKWCPECDEGLCTECEKYHLVAKLSRHHKVISVDDFKTLPTNISNLEHHCEDHQREFKLYCPHHDKLCCPLCISRSHNTCTGFMAIEDIAKDAKTSTLLINVEQSLHDTKVNIEKIIKDREQNLAKIKEQRQKFNDQMKETRDKINTHLDELEKKTLHELDNVEKSLESKIGDFLGELKERRKSVEDLQNNIIGVKSYASDLQAFFGSKQLESRADLEEKYVLSMADDERLNQIDLNCNITAKIVEIKTIPTYGSVTIDKGKTTVDLRTKKDQEAQILSVIPTTSTDINTISLKRIRQFDIPKGQKSNCVTGCAMFPNGNLAFADCDYNKRIVITNDQGVLQKEISVSPSKPFDLAILHDSGIAFSSYCTSQINILDTTSETVTKSITTTGYCDGLTHKEGTLIYCERGMGIQQQQLETKSLHTIIKEPIPWNTHVTTDDTNIYHINNESDTVTCSSMSGDKIWEFRDTSLLETRDKIWEFRDTSLLETPYGVAVDKHSNIYLASNGNNSIVVISSDGKKGKQLLKGDEIEYPWGLAIDKGKGKICVACYGGRVTLYEISYG